MFLRFFAAQGKQAKPLFAALVATLALSAVIPRAHADWAGQGEAGFVMARGNTETDTANAKLDLSNELDKWKHSALIAGLYGKSNELKSAERYEARWQTDYKLSERSFVFGALRYEEDKFGGFDYQGTASAGLGYKFIDTEQVKLTGTLGAGYRKLRPEQLVKDAIGNVIQRIKGEASDNAIANGSLNYEHKLTATTTLVNKLLVETGSDNTFAQDDLAIQVSMTDTLALSLGFGIRHNTDPPAGLEKTDKLTTANLVYKFK